MKTHFNLDGKIYASNLIEFLDVTGCFGSIKLRGWEKEKAIGDGSYENDPNHLPHLVARTAEGKPDFGFKNLREIAKQLTS